MGHDKGSLRFGDETMLERVARILGGIADHVIVVGRLDQQAPAGVTVVHDPVEDLGPLAGLAAGLSASRTDLNFVVACDMPLINPAVLLRLADMIGDHDACVAIADGHASALCGVYRSRLATVTHALLHAGERRVMRLLEQVPTMRVAAESLRDIDANLDTFLSVDTPEKYVAALRTLGP